MIAQLTGSIVELFSGRVVLDVSGMGFELGVSSLTSAQLPAAGEGRVTLLTRMLVKENAVELYGFATREERAAFDRLVDVSGVGPKLALAVLSTFAPATLYSIVAAQDINLMSQVPGVGKKKAQRLLMELKDSFAKDEVLCTLAGLATSGSPSGPIAPAQEGVIKEASAALLSMGFTPQEAELALEGCERDGSLSLEKAISLALRRLGGAL
ncbi:Holliday junction branch migration protein RuvA [Olsenella urininfantis]|uniref:Holliday junction branch migration protein RuvA n=1 Tax=Olsenella urininfantis TaxID=1871033 RepID=UPI000987453F|nr:Holliday junction branch migration protein RuvA [Olsenella urininfantis]